MTNDSTNIMNMNSTTVDTLLDMLSVRRSRRSSSRAS